jgi:hypothetical protein
MTDFPEPTPAELIERISRDVLSLPVRPIERLVALGSAVLAPLVEEVASPLAEGYDAAIGRYWLVIALGELRDPAAVPALVAAIRGSGEESVGIGFAAADALAKIGGPAIPALRELAAAGSRWERLWAYFAASEIRAEETYRWLVEALARDEEMLDVVALAIAEHRRAEAIELLAGARERAEPSKRPEIDDAILALHRGERVSELSEDWRLRYRWNPGFGVVPLHWSTITAAVALDARSMSSRRVGPAVPLEELLATPADGPETCDCCGLPVATVTGVPVCRRDAPDVAALQKRLLERIAEDEDLVDLFDVLDAVEFRLADLESEPAGSGRRSDRELADDRMRLHLLRLACVWLVEEGIETVGAGYARLGRVARGRVARATPAPEPVRAVRPGRNDPCDCGSGRKFKKCCGAV